MQELGNLETSRLVDLLAQHTADYTKMMSEGTTEEEYAKCKLIIKALQAEIESRKTNTTGSETNITPLPDFS
ncbi:MAG: hypothetical protein E6H08_16540 [Bacteroidetes bacterium]|nr:MAG: hypothetical protein E6H08_16540 [Bacteroidota bacterium]